MKETIRVIINVDLCDLIRDENEYIKEILDKSYYKKCHKNTYIISINKFKIISYPIISLTEPKAKISVELLVDTYDLEIGSILVGCEDRNNTLNIPYYENIKLIPDGSTCISDKMALSKFNVEILNVSYPDNSEYINAICRKSFISAPDNNIYKAEGVLNEDEKAKLDELIKEIDSIKIPKYVQDAFITDKAKGDMSIVDIEDGTICSRMSLNIHDGRLYDKSNVNPDTIISENIFPLKYKLLKQQLNHRKMMDEMVETYDSSDPIYKVYDMYKKIKK